MRDGSSLGKMRRAGVKGVLAAAVAAGFLGCGPRGGSSDRADDVNLPPVYEERDQAAGDSREQSGDPEDGPDGGEWTDGVKKPWKTGGLPGFLSLQGSGRIAVDARDVGGTVCQGLPAENGTPGILVPAGFARRQLRISVLEYKDSRIRLQQGETVAELRLGDSRMWNTEGVSRLDSGPRKRDGELYLPLEAVCRGFGYRAEAGARGQVIRLKDAGIHKKRGLPSSYDYRAVGRSTRVRNQGNYGTCWSFASLTALETAMGPAERKEFSADHMSLRNSFSLDQREGGEYTMSMAYLLGWQGPVLEEEDPYGDDISPEGLTPSVHVQEIQILPSGDFEAIKRAVFLYGGVQSSLYTSITDHQSRSIYYNAEKSAYCYEGDRGPNHDVVIVGWDDGYPRHNFPQEPEGDGAFLCVSSWGEEFGDGGYFYVSYYDSNIGKNGLVYTGIESVDRYDRIYQSDLCGWVGQVGYGIEKAYGANVYETEDTETLEAAGFYATRENTAYRVFLARHVGAEADLQDRDLVAEGRVEYMGFYTIPLKKPIQLEAGERFAVILEIDSPTAVHPLAVEYQVDDATAEADIGDGEGYISYDGKTWASLEEQYQCNLCLKGYTTIRAAQ